MSGKLNLAKKDFVSDQEVRWCPGCADFAILATVQKVMPELNVPRENIVFVSGIGCSSRFPYYMNTYGMHGIHGRAPAIATGLKMARPELTVFVVTGDGDGLSIGGNHLIHALRRNVDLKILLFDNRIYGLTKGQASPTSELGKKTKSSPYGTVDRPFNPLTLALGAGATFVARSVATDTVHLAQVLRRAAAHKGAAFVHIWQNCPVFNDGAFDEWSEREVRDESLLKLEHGKPLVFGKSKEKALRIPRGMFPKLWEVGDRVILAGSAPIPESVAGGSFRPPTSTFRLALLGPEVVGLNRTVSVQLAIGFRVPQLFEATAKSGASFPSMTGVIGPMMVPPVLVTVNGVLTGGICGLVSPGAGMATAGKKS